MRYSRLANYHNSMLRDTVRTEAFRQALSDTVRPGDVVVDIGCGTGILSCFACQAGARHVYAIDSGPIIETARQIARLNGFEKRITFVPGLSSKVDIPERADVLVSETLWNFGLGEGIVPTIADARQRWLKPAGKIIPESFAMVVAPVEVSEYHERLAVADHAYGLDLSPLRRSAYNTVRMTDVPESAILAPPCVVHHVDLNRHYEGVAGMEADFSVSRSGELSAIMGYFDAGLTDKVRLGNGPPNRAKSWKQAIFPLEGAIAVEPGDRVSVDIKTYYENDTAWVWETAVMSNDNTLKASFRQSTLHSQFDLRARLFGK